MSSTIPQVAAAMRHILTTQAAATERPSGFVQRRSKLTGPLFAQTLVFGWWSHPAATLEDLVLTADTLGCSLSPQALDQRFTPAAVTFLYGLLLATTAVLVAADPSTVPLLHRFTSVLLTDGCVIPLPLSLRSSWPGCGNASGPTAALKLLVQYDLRTGALPALACVGGVVADSTAARALPAAPVGSLSLRDLGFFSLPDLARLATQDRYWLMRLRVGTHVYTDPAAPLDLPTWLAAQAGERGEAHVAVGQRQRLGCRLLWERVPDAVRTARQAALLETARRRQSALSPLAWALAGWTLLLTNVPAEQLSLLEALVLVRARWQIELLFKRWKSLGRVDEWRSANPHRILCEVYAKLIALLMQHWILVVTCWGQWERSVWKAQRALQRYGEQVAGVWGQGGRVVAVLERAGRVLRRRGRSNKQPGQPGLYQLLEEPTRLAATYAAKVRRLTAPAPAQAA